MLSTTQHHSEHYPPFTEVLDPKDKVSKSDWGATLWMSPEGYVSLDFSLSPANYQPERCLEAKSTAVLWYPGKGLAYPYAVPL